MFGPLNGVRTALVVLAAVAAVAAIFLGRWVVAGLLLAAVTLHGVGWWFLWSQRNQQSTPDR